MPFYKEALPVILWANVTRTNISLSTIVFISGDILMYTYMLAFSWFYNGGQQEVCWS